MSTFIRNVPKASRAIAMQIATNRDRGIVAMEHVGPARTAEVLALLEAEA